MNSDGNIFDRGHLKTNSRLYRIHRLVGVIALALSIGVANLLWAQGAIPEPTAPEPSNPLLERESLPEHAVARLGSLRYRNMQSIQRMAYADDGTLMTVSPPDAGYNGAVQFLRTASGEVVDRIEMPDNSVHTTAISRSAKKVAAAGISFDEERTTNEWVLTVVDVATKQVHHQKLEQVNRIGAIAFSKDEKFLLIGAKKLMVWDIAASRSVLDLEVSKGGVSCLAVSPDGETIAFSCPGSIELWRWESGEQPTTLVEIPHHRQAMTLNFSHDGSQLAASIDGEFGGLQVIDLKTGEVATTLKTDRAIATTRNLLFSSDDKVVAWTNDQTKSVDLHELSSGKRIHRITALAPAPTAIAFNSDSARLACAFGQAIAVWDTERGHLIRSPHGHRSPPNLARIHDPDLPLLTYGDDGQIIAWDTAKARHKLQWRHPSVDQLGVKWVRGAAISPDGRWIVSSSFDNEVVLWDVDKTSVKYRLPGHGELGGWRTVGFTADSKQFVSFGDDRHLRVFDVQSGKAVVEHRVKPDDIDLSQREKDGHLDMSGAGLSPDVSTLWVAVAQSIYLFDVRSGKQIQKLDIKGTFVPKVAFARNGDRLFVFDFGLPQQTKLADGRIRYGRARRARLIEFHLDTGEPARQRELPFQFAGPMAISPNGKWLALQGRHAGEPIRILRVSDWEEVGALATTTPAHTLQFAGDDQLYSSMLDTSVLRWSLHNLKLDANP